MLQAIREKTSGWFATILLTMIIVTMAFFGVESYMQRRVDDYVARVEGPRQFYGLWPGQVKDIREKDFRERFDRMRMTERQQKGKDFDAVAFESVANKRKVLELLVDEALLSLSADKAGVVVTDAAVQKAILSEKGFQGEGGKFDPTVYRLVLQQNGMTPEGYQEGLRGDLLKFLVPQELQDSEISGNDEIDAYVKLRQQTRDVRFLEIPPPVEAPAMPGEDEIKAWYGTHPADYRSPEQVSVEYVEMDAANMTAASVPSDEALRNMYEQKLKKAGTADQKMASHILVALPANATPAQSNAALAKARDIVAKARAPGADFAALAKQYSDDVGSKDAGGDLGPIEKGVFGDDFDKAFFALQPGQVSEPVKLPDGYHVLWYRELVAGQAKPFEEMRAELEAEFATTERENAFNDLEGKLLDKISDDPTQLVPAAQELKLPVQRTGFFSRNNGEGIAALEQVRKAAFADAQMKDRQVSDPVEIEPSHVVVLHVLDTKPAAPIALAQVHDRIIADILRDRAGKAAKARAEAILARAKQGEDLQKLGAEVQRPVSDVPNITRQAPNPQLAPLVDAAFRLARPVAGKGEFALAKLAPDHYALVSVTAVKDGDLSKLDAQTRTQLRQQLAQARGRILAQAYIQGLRKQYTVKVVEERL